jgi:hypothetical protein
LGKCAIQWELFAESLVKLPESSTFLKKELIDFENDQPSKDLGDEHDDIQGESKAN